MEIDETRHGAVTVIRPGGPLAMGDAEQFRAFAADVKVRSLGRFIVDVSAVAYIDSAGLESLAGLSAEMADAGQTLKLCGVNETVREVFDLVGVSDQFEFCVDVTSAVRSFL
jgi:anti-sigma B factor antagonist